MKRFTTVISLLAFASCISGTLCAAQPYAALDTLNHYVIDNVAVDFFDGSQLEGKQIASYKLSTVVSAPDEVIMIHNIRTRNAAKQADPIYVIDGKKVSKRKFENLNPTGIKSITVIKNGSVEEVKQYPGWENGVILVETKESEPLAIDKDTRVNIGYGDADSRDLSYSVSSVKLEDNEFNTNLYDYLRGRVPGVMVGPEGSLYIRGISSWQANREPLILMDGIEVADIEHLKLIDPRDVYSIDVLKDASSAIYGIKGANGVILITSKMGQKEKNQANAAK